MPELNEAQRAAKAHADPGEVVRLVIDQRGLCLKEVARRAGVHPTQVSQWMTGSRRLNIDHAIKIERALGIPATLLCTLEIARRKRLDARP